MWKNSEEQFLFNHGWEHFWFSPRNLLIKEFIKGPFLKPKLLYPIPYITLCQQDGDSVRLEEGIPDCWAGYLAHNFTAKIFLRKYLRNYELMHKEDVEIVPQLRKNYRLYIGQGIPDPWISYPYIDNPEIFAHTNPKDVKKWPHRKKENCYCCKKKYLFDCPDKTNVNACSCPDCHGRNTTLTTDCGENCKCISVLRDWVLRNTDSKNLLRKNRRRKTNSKSDLSSSDDSKTKDEDAHAKTEQLVFCGCMRHYEASSDTSTSEIVKKSNEKLHNIYNGNKISGKTQSRICCCPYVKNIYGKRNPAELGGRNFHESTKTISRQIQTENPPDKDSKTVQTDNSKSKLLPKCPCSSKCSHCGLSQCKTPWTKVTFPAMQSVPNLCFAPNVIHNPAIICPYSFPNHFMIQKPSRHDEIKKADKKQEKCRLNEGRSNTELMDRTRQTKTDEKSVLRKSETKDQPTDSKSSDFNNNKSIYLCQPSAKSFDRLKYLTDEKLKQYLQREERLSGISNHWGSKFINFSPGNPSVSTINPERFKLGRFKAFCSYKPQFSESFEDSKIVYLGHNRHQVPSKLFNSSDQATMTVSKTAEKLKYEDFSQVKYPEKIGESGEIRPPGQIRSYSDSYRANKRRRRLLSNRKRRRKLAASGKSSILEYQTLLSKLTKCPELVNKEIQIEGTSQNYHFSKKVPFSEDNPSPPGTSNFSGNTSLRWKDVCLNSNPSIAGSLRKIERTARNNFVGYSKSKILGDSLRQSLRSDKRFDKALEKISNTNRGTWTANALKNIVGDTLMEKKSQEI